ncbi:MAG: zinc ribbon domain-containing protein [Sandaracinus sp.]|nr:zinc ribbon domain-containing protein [Sandaracinus sp.]MCB9623135.1 zinc ribbon domain-containing protein [Sandaracinus sp.]
MTEALPWIFALAACGALGASLVALWASFRAAFGGAVPIELSSEVDHDARLRLMEEKDALLKNLADLRFDHEASKVGDADFERLDGKLRDRAKTVMRLLDADVEPFRAEAEKLIAGRLGAMTRDPFRQVAAEKRDAENEPRESEEVTTKKEKKEVRDAMLADLDAPKDPKGGDREPEEITTKKEKKQVREALLADLDAKTSDDADAADAADAEAANDATAEATSGSKACPSCETDNDTDAVFCKKCGHRFEEAEAASAEEAQ